MKEALAAPLKAAGGAAFVVGTLLFLLNPPSLSGAEGLVSLLAGATALVIVTSWATVALMGEGMSEREFEHVVRRTEELARQPDRAEAESEFDALVAAAIDRLPAQFRDLLEQTPVVVSSRGTEHRAYGRYYGDTVARDDYPDRIVIYRDTLERDFGFDREMLAAQVERTLRHEVAHHLGWGERGVRELGL
jgi:predicted Zn-dependent protease with MMP-like domain